jgi:uncharacterized protein YmfQ (DUF2313 family)
MLHEDVLKALFPLELEGDFDTGLGIEGLHLDGAQASAGTLLDEMFPDTADELLADWERIVGVTPDDGDPIAARRDRVVAKLQARGGLSRPYFEGIAGSLGYEIGITAYGPTICGMARCGDMLSNASARYLWKVEVTNASGRDPFLEDLFLRLKPAWTDMEFSYTG